ncbi:hypothetical protein PHMEG_0002128 [Phytophthora megakarya]|uniref:Uncharacterized protein n=1 Tax=Phytophthora megakarya TaxID=4795 RepID=A0A225WZE4_9STRA|nr:hypothetical protein PHMEG_0002128 [Phytophthora megakarya]
MLIVARRKTYATPHGTGKTEWQQVAEDPNQAVDASFSDGACRDKVVALMKKHVEDSARSRRASGVAEEHTTLSDYVEAYFQLKTRFEETQQAAKDKKSHKAKRLASAGGKAMQKAAQRSSRSERDEYNAAREFLGSDYSSDEEEKQDEDGGADTEEEEEEEGGSCTRNRLRVSKIWAKKEEMMGKQRQLQAARDRNLNRVLETLMAQTKLLLEELKRTRATSPSSLQ